ncbi:MAG TPA: Yip1 family protein [Casimicrobiaceae bacterium]|nr:Yip1 family protein [Casimicrobiaceae bacterium]
MSVVRRLLWLIANPSDAWDAIALERIGVDALIARYILPLSLLPPIGSVIGMKTFDREWDAASGYLVPPAEIYAAGATTLFGTIVSIFLLAGIFRLIAPMYGSSRDYRAALKVATFGAIPVLLAGITLVLPVMIIVSVVAACHTLYLYWVGVGRVLDVSPGAQTEFIGVSVTLLCGLSTLAGGFASSMGLF